LKRWLSCYCLIIYTLCGALQQGDKNYSLRWQAIKAHFSSQWLQFGGEEARVSAGYEKQRRRGVWQARFIEHTVRDEDDLYAHAD